MGIKSGLKKIGEWVEDISKAASGAIKGTVEKGALRDFLDDFASLGGPIGFVFKVASRQLPEPTAEQTIVSEISTKFFDQLISELRAHNELCTEATFKGIIKDTKKANELLEREFSWLSLYGRSGQRTSRSWPLVNELADITEAWFTAAAKKDQRYTLENKRTIDAIRGRMADSLAEIVENVIHKPEV